MLEVLAVVIADQRSLAYGEHYTNDAFIAIAPLASMIAIELFSPELELLAFFKAQRTYPGKHTNLTGSESSA